MPTAETSQSTRQSTSPARAWSECRRQRKSRTLRPPPPHPMEQPQACSTSRMFVAAPLHRQERAGAWSRRQALCTQVPEAHQSFCTHHESAATAQRGALRHKLVALLRRQSTCKCLSPPQPHTVQESQACSISRMFAHREAAAGLLHQSGACGASIAQAKHLQVPG